MELATELYKEARSIRAELHEEARSIRAELREEARSIRTDLGNEIRGLGKQVREVQVTQEAHTQQLAFIRETTAMASARVDRLEKYRLAQAAG